MNADWTQMDAAGIYEFEQAVDLAIRGEFTQALTWVNELLANYPDLFPAIQLAAKLSLENGDPRQALKFAHRALSIKPGHWQCLEMVGRAWKLLAKPFEALQAFDAIIQLNPQLPNGYFGLAKIFKEFGSAFDASEALLRGLEIAPDLARLVELAELELSLGRCSHALEAARGALRKDPNDFGANLIAGRCCTEMRKFALAESFWAAAKKNPELSWRVEGQKGYALSIAGEFEQAEASLNACLSLNPHQGSAYELIYAGRKAVDTDRSAIQQMETLAKRSDLPDEELAPLLFALAKAWDDLDDPARAMENYERANATRARERGVKRPFNAGAETSHWNTHQQMFPEKCISPEGPALGKPIFVVGCMRSGTTLMEQILSRHSEVVGAGELDFWRGSEILMIEPNMGSLRRESVQERRNAYLRLLNSFGSPTQRVVDKYHANLAAVGLIHHAFPESPIIHMHRNPIDTAISMWMTDSSSSFLWEKQNIIFAIRQAIEQADYWRSKLPSNRFLDVSYEDLVFEPEQWTRMTLEFCGLPWEEACLAPANGSSNVRTVSVWQVRQPVYRGSVGRWKRYRDGLGEFEQLVSLE